MQLTMVRKCMKFYLPSEYQEKCQVKFQYYKVEILKLLPQAKVEHIGASAIPDLISKGDLDIYVGIDQNQMNDAIQRFEILGFRVKKDTLRTPQLCMLEHSNEDCAIQLVVLGSEFEFFLHFRDLLISSKVFREQYNQLKRESVGLNEDDYRQKKSIFIESVLASRDIEDDPSKSSLFISQ